MKTIIVNYSNHASVNISYLFRQISDKFIYQKALKSKIGLLYSLFEVNTKLGVYYRIKSNLNNHCIDQEPYKQKATTAIPNGKEIKLLILAN